MPEQKNVVVIGLGLGGMHLINALEGSLPASHRIIAISKHDFGYQLLASLRATVQPGWEEATIMPLDQVFKKDYNVVLGGVTVTGVTRNSVRLDKAVKEFGYEVPFDILVFATGSLYSFPARIRAEDQSAEDVKRAMRAMQTGVSRAKSILVLGGGAIGVEWAGEVAEAYPNKRVTLVHSHDRLWSPVFKRGLHDTIASDLQRRGVRVVLNKRIDYEGDKSGPISPRRFDIGKGETVEADFVFIATGNKANGSLAAQLARDAIDGDGAIKVKPTLQIDSKDASLSRIFATGDVSAAQSSSEMKTAMNAKAQAVTLAKNIVALVNDKPLSNFKTPPTMGLITVGPTGGAAQLFGMVLGAWMAKMMKGKDAANGIVYPAYHLKAPPTSSFVKA